MNNTLDESLKARLAKARKRQAAPIDAIPERPADIDPPLSSGQARLWYLNQVEPDSAVYNLVEINRLAGNLNVSALERTLNEAIETHEILRTRFTIEGDAPVQKIEPAWEFCLSVEDFSDQSEQLMLDRISEMVQEPFTLDAVPLFRFLLLRQGAAEHVLLMVFHHSIFDGISVELLLRELKNNYQRHSAQSGSNSAKPVRNDIQYGDYAHWQQQWLASEAAEKQLQFWVDQHHGQDTPLELNTDLPRPGEQSTRGDAVRRVFSEDILGPFEQLLHEHKSTLFMGLLALLGILLHKHTHQSAMNIGAPASGRGHRDLETALGYFANTLVFHIEVNPKDTFSEHLNKVRQLCLASYQNQDITFDRVVNAINPPRDVSRTPLYQVLLAFQDKTTAHVDFGDVQLEHFESDIRVARTDLTFWIERDETALSIALEYCIDLFELSTVNRMLDHLESLLRLALTNDGQPISQLNPLTDAELQQVDSGNDTQIVWPAADTLSLIAAAVVEHGDKPAVIAADRTLTYQELNETANEIAERLLDAGLQFGATVGICLQRTSRLPAAILGIWKAGCVYLPMDPDFPPARLHYMLEKAAVGIMLTDAITSQLSFDHVTALNLDAPLPDFSPADTASGMKVDDRLYGAADPEALAYTMFTSGSTGNPKGVMVPHRAVANFLQSMAATPGFGCNNRILAVTTLSFDISVLELLLPLTVGGSLVIASREDTLDARSLMRLIDAHEVDTMQATPVTWKMLLSENWQTPRQVSGAFRALCGGEALSPILADQIVKAGAELWNMYGPTETTVWSTCSNLVAPITEVTLGEPIGNTQCFVVNPYNQLCPIGVSGELCICGLGLSDGYMGELELTAKSFVDLAIPGRREPVAVYKTGDIVVRKNDGSLLYKHRNDTQVKLRGFRIETGDIEAALLRLEGVEEAQVIVKNIDDSDARLLAYLCYTGGYQPSTIELRKHLGSRVPAYMVPQQFISVAEMPLTANGKVDRKALTTLGGERDNIGVYLAPQTNTEIALARIWCEALDVDKVSVDSIFFDIGGHSLLSISVIQKIERETGVRLGPRDMMLNTLQQIAASLKNKEPDRRVNPPETSPVPVTGAKTNPLKRLLLKALGR